MKHRVRSMAWPSGPFLLVWDGDDEDVCSGAKAAWYGDDEDVGSGAKAWVEAGKRTRTPSSPSTQRRRVVWPMSRGGVDFMVLPFPFQGSRFTAKQARRSRPVRSSLLWWVWSGGVR